MATFILKTNQETRTELYSDIALEFLDLILIEAIFVIIQLTRPMEWPIIDDPIYYCDDPESQFECSVEYLLSVLNDTNREDGIIIPGSELTEYDPEFHESVCVKLSNAIDSLRTSNDITEIMMLKDVLLQPAYAKRFNFTTMHLNDRVVFNIVPAEEQMLTDMFLGAPLPGLRM